MAEEAKKKKGGGTKVIVVQGAKKAGRAAVAAHNASGAGFVVAGLALMWVGQSDMVRNSAWAKYAWWAVPIGFLVAGLILWRRKHKYAAAVLVAGGMLLAQALKAENEKKAAANKDATKGPPDYVWQVLDNGQIVGNRADTGDPGRVAARNITDAVYGRQRAAA